MDVNIEFPATDGFYDADNADLYVIDDQVVITSGLFVIRITSVQELVDLLIKTPVHNSKEDKKQK